MKAARTLIVAIFVLGLAVASASAQGRGGGGAAAPPRTAKQAAPIDMTGYWVAYITEDWRYRMMTPPKGDYRGVTLSAEAKKVADAWDPAADEASGNQCKFYGAAAIMRVPSRFHITWQDDNTLLIESDAGTQKRVLHFTPTAPPSEATWQGLSIGEWDMPSRSLKVTTTNMKGGYLRRNGVPYSDKASVTEYFDIGSYPGNRALLVVTTVVTDPVDLQRPYITSTHFIKERDGSKWNPTPCSARW
jgi:hypothetical protein